MYAKVLIRVPLFVCEKVITEGHHCWPEAQGTLPANFGVSWHSVCPPLMLDVCRATHPDFPPSFSPFASIVINLQGDCPNDVVRGLFKVMNVSDSASKSCPTRICCSYINPSFTPNNLAFRICYPFSAAVCVV